jgi:hypothetical protein
MRKKKIQMSKSTVLESIKDEWAQFLEVIESVPAEKQELSDAVGYWSVAQCLRHVASWDEEVIDIVNIFVKSGDKTEIAGAHVEAKQLLQDRQKMDLATTWQYLYDAHTALMSYLEPLSGELFDTESYTGNWIGNAVPQHYKGHREDVEKFMNL